MLPEFSRIVSLDSIIKEKTLTLSATPEECLALAKRIGIQSLHSLEGEATLTWKDATHLILKAHFNAKMQVMSAHTLDPVQKDCTCEIEEEFTTEQLPSHEEIEMTLEELLEQPEVIEGDSLDVGEIFAQYLVLECDPFDTAEDTPPFSHIEEEFTNNVSPFEKLKDLKKSDE